MSNVMDVYNSSLTRTNNTTLSVARFSAAGATVGNYLIIAGGYTSSVNSPRVDVYTVA